MSIYKFSRRVFLKIISISIILSSMLKVGVAKEGKPQTKQSPADTEAVKKPLGTESNGTSNVYIARGMSPEENVKRVLELMGGIDTIIGSNDIVILKPNAQWWNQGTTNTNNMKGFIDLVLNIPEFQGEVIIAENHHYKELDSRGWNTNERNGDYNLNELVQYYNDAGHDNVSKYHWVDGGPNPLPQEGDGGNGRVVSSVAEGDGYVWASDKVYESKEGRRCMMTYPVFTSSYSGKKIDICRGSLIDDEYVDNVRLINFSCLNHHGNAFGVTASVKNLMGIPDMTCGFQGTEPEGMFNIHFIGKMSLLYKTGIDLKYYGKKFGFGSGVGRKVMGKGSWHTEYTGGALGYWMKNVRMPDLNILAAEYVGWGGRGRSGPHKRSRANCVATSFDPVALDYIGSKEILLPATPDGETHYKELNSPDNPPFKTFLEECSSQGVGNLNPDQIKVTRLTENNA